MKPVISYYGGKQRLAKRIINEINEIPHEMYAEPFAGGAAVLFAKERSNREALNDINGDIINLYRVIQDHGEVLARLIQCTPYSKEEHTKARIILKDTEFSDPVRRAWATIVQCRQSFSKTMFAGWSRSRKYDLTPKA